VVFRYPPARAPLAAMEDATAGAGHREDGQEWYMPELLRIKGEVLLRQIQSGMSRKRKIASNQRRRWLASSGVSPPDLRRPAGGTRHDGNESSMVRAARKSEISKPSVNRS
jgi:hypothetical protein